jgi:hypothetical protein
MYIPDVKKLIPKKTEHENMLEFAPVISFLKESIENWITQSEDYVN